MKHKQIQKQLSAYLDDELDLSDRRQVEMHLRTCSECAEILADFRHNSQGVTNLRQTAPLGIWEAVQEQIAAGNGVKDRNRWRRWIFRPITASVATLAMCLILAIVYFKPTSQLGRDPLDYYLMAHTEYAIHNPLTSNLVRVDSLTDVDELDSKNSDSVPSDDTGSFLDVYLDAYFGDDMQ